MTKCLHVIFENDRMLLHKIFICFNERGRNSNSDYEIISNVKGKLYFYYIIFIYK